MPERPVPPKTVLAKDEDVDPPDPDEIPAGPERPGVGRSVLDEPSADERGIGWSEPSRDGDGRGDDWYLRERPPHHG